MDLLTSMQVFVRAVDKGSLSAAAEACGMSATMAGNHLRALETRLGTKLLHRTTRRHSLTAFGETYLARCQEILRLIADTDTQAQNQQAVPSGRLRVTAPVSFGSEALVPALADYLASHPQVRVELSLSDRTVDLVDEGFDVAIRIGTLPDSGLVARSLAPYRMMVCASPAYLQRRGTPRSPDELVGHECIAFSPAATASWHVGEDRVEVNGQLQINHGQALRVAALNGLGIVMQPAVLLAADVAAGRLVALFPDHPLGSRPMQVVYLPDQRSLKLRSFVEFVVGRFGSTPSRR
jgi:DNA-binding transcriptional LysR family regulator